MGKSGGGCAYRCSKSKLSAAPDVGLVTENVLVPITKTFLTKEAGRTRCNVFDGKTELIKSRKWNENLSIPLLREPSYLLASGHSNASLHSQQWGRSSGWSKGCCTDGTDPSRFKSDRSSAPPVLLRFNQNRSQRSTDEIRKRRNALPFPSPMTDLPDDSLGKRKPLSMNIRSPRHVGESVANIKKNREAPYKISRALTNVSKAGDTNESSEVKETYCIAFRPVHGSQQSNHVPAYTLTTVYNEEDKLSRNSIPSTPITMSMTATTVKSNLYSCKERPTQSFRAATLKRIDAALKRTSSNIISSPEEFNIPRSWNELCISDQVPFSLFDVSMSRNDGEKNETDTSANTFVKIDSAHDFRSSRHERSSSILSVVRGEKASLWQNGKKSSKDECSCKIKYSWQVVGTSSQTSRTLLESCFAKENELANENESAYDCCVKYSWQIIGIATQTSTTDFNVSECGPVVSFLYPMADGARRFVDEPHNARPVTIQRNGKRFFILNNQYTQTFAHKESQTNFSEIYAKYM